VLYWQFWNGFWDSWAEQALGKDGLAKSQLPDGTPPLDEATIREALHSPKLRRRAQEEFFASVNHDLRTPLNAVIGFAQIIENEMFGKVPQQYLEYARHIQDSGYELLEKIETLIDQPLATCETKRTPSVTTALPTPKKAKKLAAAE
jgi:signal transduction histidine kinase